MATRAAAGQFCVGRCRPGRCRSSQRGTAGCCLCGSPTRGGRCRTPGLRQAQVEGRSRSVRGIIWGCGLVRAGHVAVSYRHPKVGVMPDCRAPRLRRHRVLCGPPRRAESKPPRPSARRCLGVEGRTPGRGPAHLRDGPVPRRGCLILRQRTTSGHRLATCTASAVRTRNRSPLPTITSTLDLSGRAPAQAVPCSSTSGP
jgi:hypothetical protein